MKVASITWWQSERERYVYSTAPCDFPISVLKSTVSPALTEAEQSIQSRRKWLLLLSHTEMIAWACSSFIHVPFLYVCVCFFPSKSLLFLSHLLLQHFVPVVRRLASPIHNPNPSFIHSLTVCGWDKLSLAMYARSEGRQLRVRQYCMDVGQCGKMSWKNWPDYQLLMR